MSDKSKKIYFLLPAYNELPALKQMFPRIPELITDYEIVLVDDGSNDGTAEYISSVSEKYNCRYLKHTVNRGLGTAIATGLEYILSAAPDEDVVIVMDADNTHDIASVPVILEKLEELPGYDIVTASRYVPGAMQSGVSLSRRIMSTIINLMFRLIFRIRGVKDYTCGYRGYRMSVIRKYYTEFSTLPVSVSSFPASSEILILLAGYGARCSEIPFHLRYNLKTGRSKLKLLSTIFDYIVLLVRLKIKR